MCYCGASDCPSCGVAQGYHVAWSPVYGYHNPEDEMEELELPNDPREWNWAAAIKECKAQDPYDGCHALFIGSVMSIMPSGKYWGCFASGNVDEAEQERDIAYQEILEQCAHDHGGWIENGLNGDYCDMFFCLPCEEVESEYDEDMDGDHDSAMASAGHGTDEDYGGCDDRI